MGLKIPLVAVLSVILLGQAQSLQVYLGAALATLGVRPFRHRAAGKKLRAARLPSDRRILWATASAALYALSDIYIRRCLAFIGPVQLAMWNYTFIGLFCLVSLFQPHFRQYKSQAAIRLLLANGICLLLSVMAFFASIAAAGQVTTPTSSLPLAASSHWPSAMPSARCSGSPSNASLPPYTCSAPRYRRPLRRDTPGPLRVFPPLLSSGSPYRLTNYLDIASLFG